MAKSVINKRRQQALKTRKRFYDTALALFLSRGYENVTVDEICGDVVLSALSDKYRRRKLFLVAAVLAAIPMIILIQTLSSIVLLGACGFMFGFFLVPALPVGLTFTVEKTHPVPEATSNGMLMLSGQISGIPIVIFFDMKLNAALFCIGLILALLLKEGKANQAKNSAQE